MADSNEPKDAVVAHHWETLSRETMVSCPIFSLISKKCRHPERGVEGEFYYLDTHEWVMVLPVTQKGEVPLVNQYRFGVETTSWEIPGGVMDAGEDPIEAGLRELKEETGYTSKNARVLGSVRPNPAIQNNTCHLVLALNAEKTEEVDWDEHEELEFKMVSLDRIYEMAFGGEIVHALVMNALLLFYPEWQKTQARRRASDA